MLHLFIKSDICYDHNKINLYQIPRYIQLSQANSIHKYHGIVSFGLITFIYFFLYLVLWMYDNTMMILMNFDTFFLAILMVKINGQWHFNFNPFNRMLII